MKPAQPERQASLARQKNVYTDWEAACRASRHEKAVTKDTFTVRTPRGTFKVRWVKTLRGDPHAVYASAEGIRVHDWKPTNAMVDAVHSWKAY